jgi:RNA polymerase sigma-70 factor (ECF subfamily)
MSRREHDGIVEPCGLEFADLARLSDETVMAHLQAGHADALAVIFDRYHRLVLSVAMKILRDVGEAEDLMQSVFLEIYKVVAQFDPAKGTTKGWLLQYAYHRGLNRRHHLNVRNFYQNSDIAEVPENLLVGEISMFTDQETRRLVKEALGTLNDAQSRVLKLAYFEGLSFPEIAERTGENLGNVRHHYYRGLTRLRTIVSQPAKAKGKVQGLKQEPADAET